MYVGDTDRIQLFASDGTFQSQLPLPEEGFAGSLALDPVSGDVYIAFPFLFGQPKAPIFRLDHITGEVVDTLVSDVARPTRVEGLFVDPDGNVHAILNPESCGGTGTRTADRGVWTGRRDSRSTLPRSSMLQLHRTQLLGSKA